ncbi:MAG: DUF1592 domain-containing protein [Lentisphaeraceae bacterium]|nr:DUF1592 domain-containing protein [Lentisphaeraceae bacterium]
MIVKMFGLFLAVGIFPVFGNAKFNEEIKPLINKYCISCHGPKVAKAKLRMDNLDPDMVNGKDGEMWQEALDLINTNDMPTKNAKVQPTNEEREKLVEWITYSLRKAIEAQRSTGGNIVMRRLTAYEYNNTMRDLLKLDLDYARDLPVEGLAKEGFVNNTKVLGTSALHFEYFKKIARESLAKIIMVPEMQPAAYSFKSELEFKIPKGETSLEKRKSKGKTKKTVKKTLAGLLVKMILKMEGSDGLKKISPVAELHFGEVIEGKGVILAGNRDVDKLGDPFAEDEKIGGSQGAGRTGYQPNIDFRLLDPPYTGKVLVRVKASAIPGKGGTFPYMSLEFGSFRGAGYTQEKEFANIEVKASMKKPQVFEFYVQAENYPIQANGSSAKHVTNLRVYNDFRRGTSQLTYEELPKLFIDSIEVIFNGGEIWPPVSTQNLLIDSKNKGNEEAYLTDILKNFMPKAFRRPVSDAEVAKKVDFFKRIRPSKDSYKSALVTTLTTVLCSPHFLLIVEPHKSDEKRKLNEFELASRLSYFLWSSMPDNELFSLAMNKKLSNPAVLRAQVKRMIEDPKSSGFVHNFTAQWLDTEGIHRVNVNPEYFSFDDTKKFHFADETVAFVETILKENLSIENFIDSDFAVINTFMARHYRIPGVAGSGFIKVPLKPGYHRGGVLTHASVMLGNSTGAETHPVKRGVWLLERMLNDPPPEPPASVPELEEPEKGEEGKLSLKERLLQHAQVESCNGCHSKIDPYGVAFENYNALGQWREGSQDPFVHSKHRNVTVDPTTSLKNGTKIDNLKHLKNFILTEKKEHFTKAVINKVMSYGIGRYIEFSDRKNINSIYEKVRKSDYKFQTLIESVVLTETFLTK